MRVSARGRAGSRCSTRSPAPAPRRSPRQPAGASLSVLGPDRQGIHAASPTARACWRSAAASAFRRWCSWPRACSPTRAPHWKPLVLMGSEIPFPFRARPSRILVPAAPAEAIACMPLLDEWGVPSRLASNAGYAGLLRRPCHGTRRTLARGAGAGRTRRGGHLRLRSDADAGGNRPPGARTSRCPARSRSRNSWPAPSAAAPAARSRCAPAKGRTMQRVCVDGPVFEAHSVYPDRLAAATQKRCAAPRFEA